MISTNEFRTGMTIELEGDIFTIVDFQHVKPGKGSAFVRSKLKNVRTGAVVEKTFRAGEKVPRAHMDKSKMQFLYLDGDNYVFMDNDSYEQLTIHKDELGDGVKYLKDNMVIDVVQHQGKTVGIELPNFVILEVVETEPGIRGDTATGASKAATLETGAIVQVPLFINVGDKLRVDTRTGQYLDRAQS